MIDKLIDVMPCFDKMFIEVNEESGNLQIQIWRFKFAPHIITPNFEAIKKLLKVKGFRAEQLTNNFDAGYRIELYKPDPEIKQQLSQFIGQTFNGKMGSLNS